MRFTAEIEMDNDAFVDGGYGPELTRILRVIAEQINQDDQGRIIRDINGNTVGSWQIGEN